MYELGQRVNIGGKEGVVVDAFFDVVTIEKDGGGYESIELPRCDNDDGATEGCELWEGHGGKHRFTIPAQRVEWDNTATSEVNRD